MKEKMTKKEMKETISYLEQRNKYLEEQLRKDTYESASICNDVLAIGHYIDRYWGDWRKKEVLPKLKYIAVRLGLYSRDKELPMTWRIFGEEDKILNELSELRNKMWNKPKKKKEKLEKESNEE